MFKIINFSFHKCCNVKYSDIQYISACTWECGALVFNQYLCTEVKSCVFNLWSAGLCVQILQYYKTPLYCMIKRMEKYKNVSDTEWATESGVLKPNDCFWFLPNQSNVLDRISGWRGGRGVSVRIICNVHLRWTASLNHRLLMPDPLFLSLFDSICRTRVGSDWCSRDYNLQPLSSALICFDMRLRSVWQRQRWWCKPLCIKAIIIYINTVFTHRWKHRDGVSAERRGWCRSLTAANSSSIRNRIINSGLPYDEATPVGFLLCFC